MPQQSEERVDIETNKTLNNIQEVTLKIKRELVMINKMICDNGNLSVAVDEANNTLTRVAQKLGVKSLDELVTIEDNNELNLLNLATVDGITQKLMSVMDT